MSNQLTMDQFKEVLPAKMKKSVNPALLDKINKTLEHPETLAVLRENILSFTSVMNDGRFKLENYINAVKYCSFKFMGDTNRKAYIRTFPDKYQKFLDDGVKEKAIAAYYTAYSKTKLVMAIMEQSMVPCYVANNHVFQDAINVQASLMNDPDVSAKVRSDAANSLMTHLKPPEKQQIEIDIGVQQGSVIDDYQANMAKMVEEQQRLIAAGADVKQIANASVRANDKEDVIEAEVTEVKEIDTGDDNSPLNMVP